METFSHRPARPRIPLEVIPNLLPAHSRDIDQRSIGNRARGVSRIELKTVAVTPRDSFVAIAGFTTRGIGMIGDFDDQPASPELTSEVQNVVYQSSESGGE